MRAIYRPRASLTMHPADTDPFPAERRGKPRFQPTFGTVIRLLFPDRSPTVGLVWNISETGISMLLAEPLGPGTEVAGELDSDGGGGAALRVIFRVVHLRELPNGDYFLGGQFLRPLSLKELGPFVAVAPAAVAAAGGS